MHDYQKIDIDQNHKIDLIEAKAYL